MKSAMKNIEQKMSQRRRLLSVVAAAGAVASFTGLASADTASWLRATNASWGTPSNWATPDGAPLPPNSATVNVVFTGTPTIAGSVTQNGTFTINGMTMTSTFAPGGNFNVSGAATPSSSWLNIGAGGVTNQNTLQLGFTTGTGPANINLTADQTWTNGGAGVNGTISVNRTMSGTGKMTKAGDGLLILQQASPNWSGGLDFSNGQIRLAGNEGGLGTGPVGFVSSNDTIMTASSGSSGTATDQHLTNNLTFGGTGTASFAGSFNFFFGGTSTMATDKNINASKTIFVNGAVSGPGVWNQVGGGTVVLATPNTNGGFKMTSGRVITTNDNQLGVAGAPVTLNGGSLVFGANINSTRTVNTLVATGGTMDLNGNAGTFGAVNGSGTGRLSVRNAGTLTVSSFNVGPLNVGTSSFMSVKAGSPVNIAAATLTVNTGGQLDLRDNDLVVGANQTAQVYTYIQAGYNFGGFDGTGGITSSTARNGAGNTTLGMLTADEYANNNGSPTFDGYTVQAGDTLVKYTYYGDVDFNGAIDASDYNLIDFGFVNHLTGWANGDADYSGGVDASDYNVIDFAYSSQNNVVLRAVQYLDGSDRSTDGMSDPALQEVMKHYNEFGDSYAAGFLANVPEPTTLGGVLLVAAASLCRRQRRHQKVNSR